MLLTIDVCARFEHAYTRPYIAHAYIRPYVCKCVLDMHTHMQIGLCIWTVFNSAHVCGCVSAYTYTRRPFLSTDIPWHRYIHTYIYTYTPGVSCQQRSRTGISWHECIHTYIYIYIYIHTYPVYPLSSSRVQAFFDIYTYIYAYMYMNIHTYPVYPLSSAHVESFLDIYTYIHIYIHTYATNAVWPALIHFHTILLYICNTYIHTQTLLVPCQQRSHKDLLFYWICSQTACTPLRQLECKRRVQALPCSPRLSRQCHFVCMYVCMYVCM